MKKLFFLILCAQYFLFAHTVYHEAVQKGISLKVYYSTDDPASFSAYEIFAPNASLPFAKGRTDKNGVVSFLPDTPGEWKIKFIGESDHGYHGKEMTVIVDDNMDMSSFSQSIYEKYQRAVTGFALVFGILSFFGMYICKKRAKSAL